MRKTMTVLIHLFKGRRQWWKKDRRYKIPNVKIRQMIAQESGWKPLLTLYIARCHCLEVAKATLHSFTAECRLLRLKQEKILVNSIYLC
jgi:hypothetical protein